MFKKTCPTCRQNSFSSCETNAWHCPICSFDLSVQTVSLPRTQVLKGKYPFKKQLTFRMSTYKINQQA